MSDIFLFSNFVCNNNFVYFSNFDISQSLYHSTTVVISICNFLHPQTTYPPSWLLPLLLLLGHAHGHTASSRASMDQTSVKPFSVIYANSLTTMGFRCSTIKRSREAELLPLNSYEPLGSRGSRSWCSLSTMPLQAGV